MPEDTGVSEAFDNSVAIVGRAMVVGTFGLEGTASSAGRAYVFTRLPRDRTKLSSLPRTLGLRTASAIRSPSQATPSWSAPRARAPGALVGARASPWRAVYFFTKSVSGWHQTAEMLGVGPPSCCLGEAVATSGRTASVVGRQRRPYSLERP